MVGTESLKIGPFCWCSFKQGARDPPRISLHTPSSVPPLVSMRRCPLAVVSLVASRHPAPNSLTDTRLQLAWSLETSSPRREVSAFSAKRSLKTLPGGYCPSHRVRPLLNFFWNSVLEKTFLLSSECPA